MPEGVFRKRFKTEEKRLTRGSHPSGSNFETELAGAEARGGRRR